MKQLRVKVFGKVQGVFFRQSTKEKADSLSIKGIVMNEDDGSVFIVAQGEEIDLENFLIYCKIGPPAAKVENILVEELDVQDFKDFRILR